LLAAAKNTEVKFLIIRSTSTATPAVQEEYRLATLLALHGYTTDEIAPAREFVRAKFAAPASGDWSRYDALAAAQRDARWFAEVGGAPAHDHPAHDFWRQNGSFDPLPLARAATIPILWLNAEFDESSPSAKTIADLRTIQAGNITSVTIPRADHGMMEAAALHVTDEALPQATGFAPEFLGTIRAWLTKLR
jgi:pimeloyl-ACP methyl ester carboxylesterase